MSWTQWSARFQTLRKRWPRTLDSCRRKSTRGTRTSPGCSAHQYIVQNVPRSRSLAQVSMAQVLVLPVPMESCKFTSQCWRPLCPYAHPKEERRAQRWAELWTFLAEEETRQAQRLGMPRIRRNFSIRHYAAPASRIEYVTPAPDDDSTGPAPVTEFVDTSHVVTYAAPAPVIDYAEPAVTDTASASADVYMAPAPAVSYAAPAPVIEYADEPAVTYRAPVPVNENVAPVPAVSHAAPAPASECAADHSRHLHSACSCERKRGSSTCRLACPS